MVKKLNEKSTLIGAIEKDMPSLSKAFKRVGRFVLKSPADFMHKTINELSILIEVSEPTIIRFCRHYSFNGVPDFRIALALSTSSVTGKNAINRLEPSLVDRSFINQKNKQSIANCARKFVSTGQSIIIDSGSTMSLFAETLKSAPALTILTTGLNVMEALWGCEQHTLMLPGGIVNFNASSLTGRMVEAALKEMHFDMIFLGADSILSGVGLSTFNEAEAHQNKIMINAANKLILLADSSKFRQPALHHICSIERIYAVITDNGISKEDVETLSGKGIKVVIAD